MLHPREARGLKDGGGLYRRIEQGTFPRIYVNDWKLSPLARRELRTLGIDLETGEHYQTQEAMAFYCVVTNRKAPVIFGLPQSGQRRATAERFAVLDESLQNGPRF